MAFSVLHSNKMYGKSAICFFRSRYFSSNPISSGSGGGTGPGTTIKKFTISPPWVPKVFDTFDFVVELERAGLTRDQAVVIMKQVKIALAESTAHRTELLATKQDLLNLNSELSEKTFNATMRFDIAQRHMKEIYQKDLLNLKADLLAADQKDSALLQAELAARERASVQRREADENRFAALHAEIGAVERRILQYGLGTLVTLATLALGVARLVL